MRLRRRRPPLCATTPNPRRICRNQRPAGLPALLRGRPCSTSATAHRHRPRPLARQQDFIGPLESGADQGPAARPTTDRHLHRIHDIRHQRHRDDDPDARPLRRSRNADDQRGPLPGRTRPELRLRLAGAIHAAVEEVPRRRSSADRRGSLEERKRVRKHGTRARKRSAAAGGSRSRPAATAWSRGRAGCSRARSGRPQGQPQLSGLSSRRDCPRAPARRKQLLRTHRQPASITSRTPRDGDRHAAYRMVATLQLPTATTTSASRASRLVRPADPRQPSETEIHGRIRHSVDGDRVKLIAWHRGTTPTGWRTTCSTRSPTTRCVGLARSTKVLIPNPKPKRGPGGG